MTRSILLALIASYGLIVGSFLNAWMWRIHTHRSVAKGRSMCPHCKTSLRWYELIPVLSWLVLRGKCRTCHRAISIQYPLIELVTAGVWAGLFWYINPLTLQSALECGVWIIVGTCMIAAFVYDAKWMILPDEFVAPSIITALLWLIVRAVWFAQGSLALWQLAAALVFGGLFFLLWRMSRGALLGDGDIGLAVVMGLLLTPAQLAIAIFVAFNLGAIVGIGLIAARLKKRSDPIAFGPFLIIGLVVGYLCGAGLMSAYLSLLG